MVTDGITGANGSDFGTTEVNGGSRTIAVNGDNTGTSSVGSGD